MVKAYSDSVKFVVDECPMVFSLVEVPEDNKFKASVVLEMRSDKHNPVNMFLSDAEVEALYKLCGNYLQARENNK
jgi:hypothetical protein